MEKQKVNIFEVMEETQQQLEGFKKEQNIEVIPKSHLSIILNDVLKETFSELTPFNKNYLKEEFEKLGMPKAYFNTLFDDLKCKHVLGYTPLHARDLVKQEFSKRVKSVTLNEELKTRGVFVQFDTDEDDTHGKQQLTDISTEVLSIKDKAYFAAGGHTDTLKKQDFVVDLINFNDELKLKFDKSTINLNVDHQIKKGVRKRKQELYVKIQFNKSEVKRANDEYKKLMVVLFGSDEDRDLDKAVLQHFIWQIKQRIIGRNPTDHMMPIFYGKQGGGKTEFIKRFCSIIEEGLLFGDFGDFNHENKSRMFTDFPVCFLDELQKATGKDMGEIKGQITAEFVQYRPLYTNDIVTERALSTYIGATNKPVSHQIKDDTGMRRFYEFKVQDKLDWDLLATVNWETIWCSVDEFSDSPLNSVKSELIEAQEELRDQDIVEIWMREYLESISSDTTLTQAKAWGEYFNPYQQADVKYRIDKQEFYKRLPLSGDKVDGVAIKAVNQRSVNIEFKIDAAQVTTVKNPTISDLLGKSTR